MSHILQAFDQIMPFVRFAGPITFAPFEETVYRVAYDHRLFYVQSGSMAVDLEGSAHTLLSGGAILIRAGVPYRLQIKNERVVLLVVNFDFFAPADPPFPPFALPMCNKNKFDPEKLTERIAFADGFLSEGFYIKEKAYSLQAYFETLVTEYKRLDLMCASELRSLLTLCLNDLYRHHSQSVVPRADNAKAEILAYLSLHFTEPQSNQTIAERFHYHPNYISQLIREQTGLSLHQYVLRLRMLKAADLLLSGNLSVGEIAQQSGFSDTSYFSHYFRRCFGCTPSAFRGENENR